MNIIESDKARVTLVQCVSYHHISIAEVKITVQLKTVGEVKIVTQIFCFIGICFIIYCYIKYQTGRMFL